MRQAAGDLPDRFANVVNFRGFPGHDTVIRYGRSDVAFYWEGFDEMDEVRGSGFAELLDDGSVEIEFEYHRGDDAILKAVRDASSAAC